MIRGRYSSGLAWLGDLPSHWQLKPLGTVFRERRTTVSDTEFPPLSVTMGGIVPQMANVALSDNNDQRKLVRSGDFVINSRSDRKGSGGLSLDDGSVSVISTVLTPRGIEPRFVHHLLRSTAFQEEFYRWGSGIVADLWSTRYSAMRRILLPIPPTEEQVAIADFLDRETAKIDALIEKQQALIATLWERHAHAVESAIESCGEAAGALGYFVSALPGYAFASEGFSTNEDDVRLLRGVNVKAGGIDWTDVVYWPKSVDGWPAEYELQVGDIVLGLDRPFVAGGTRAAVISEADVPCLLLQRVLRLRARRGVDPRYIELLLLTRGFREYATPEFTGVSVPHLSDKQVRSFRVEMPTLERQREIATGVLHRTAQIQRLVSKAERFIELAKERRAALITAAVTGQLDVSTGKVA